MSLYRKSKTEWAIDSSAGAPDDGTLLVDISPSFLTAPLHSISGSFDRFSNRAKGLLILPDEFKFLAGFE